MRLHILGVGGTFMGSLAILAKQLGHQVTGVDGSIYEPMASNLANHGIASSSYEEDPWLQHDPIDVVIVGNAMVRGHATIEWLLNSGMPFTSGPAWLAEHVLSSRKVIAVSGTHGKTSVTTLIAWLLTQLGLEPGYFIGGIPHDLPANVALGKSDWFVIESDEYDSAFFDKRPKFIHYRPEIAVINNIEFDHADIYQDLDAIIKQFGYFLRNVPSQGHVVAPAGNGTIDAVLQKCPWAKHHQHGVPGSNVWVESQAGHILQLKEKHASASIEWPLLGQHNQQNCLAALSVLNCMGYALDVVPSLSSFKGVKRRLELQYSTDNRRVYSDFGHHPTAIKLTLEGLKKHYPKDHLTAVIHMTSNSMHGGSHDEAMQALLSLAQKVVVVCEDQASFIRVSQWILPKHVHVTVSAESLPSLLQHEKSQGQTDDGSEAEMIVVFSNKNVQPLIEAACLC